MTADPMVQCLIHAVAESLILLAESDEDEVNPDVAVRGMEHISSSLLRMSDEDRGRFLRELEALAGEQREGPFRTFLLSIPTMIGMVEE